MQYYLNMQIQTTEMAVYNSSPSLVKISKEIGDGFLFSFLGNILLDLSDFFNIGKGLSPQQIIWLAKEIKKDYYYLKPTELKLCFDNAKKGKYGKLYDRLDGMIIYEWIETYLSERTNVVIKQNSNDKVEHQRKFDDIILPILKSINLEHIEKPKEVKPKEKLPYHDIHQKWIDLYGKLRTKKSDTSGRFLKRYGMVLDLESYINYKAEQLFRVKAYLNQRNQDLL